MSRTIRRKSGDRWFTKKQRVYIRTGKMYSWEGRVYSLKDWDNPLPVCWLAWESIQARPEFDKKLEAEWTRDKYQATPGSQDLKWHSNKVSRADQREQLHLIMRGQEHYDDSYELKLTKGLAWVYD